jgi:hypothetical protein
MAPFNVKPVRDPRAKANFVDELTKNQFEIFAIKLHNFSDFHVATAEHAVGLQLLERWPFEASYYIIILLVGQHA